MWQFETQLFASSYIWLAYIRRVTAPWWRQSAKNQVSTNRNLRNRWFLIVKRTNWRCPYDNDFWPISSGDLSYNFRCLKRFFRKVLQKLGSIFFLKLRFLKIQLLVMWLKCLVVPFIIRFTHVRFSINNVAVEQINLLVSFFPRVHKDLLRKKVFVILVRVIRGVIRVRDGLG